MRSLFAVCLWTLVAASCLHAEVHVSDLSFPAGKLGENWTGPTGLVVDDVNAPAKKDDPVAADELLVLQMKSIGVAGFADFTYRNAKSPTAQVTVRVFQFEDEEHCQAWMKKKYQYDGWEKHYKKLDLPYAAFDSLQMKKRIVAIGKYWLTANTIASSDDHLKALDLVVEKLKPAKEDNVSGKSEKSESKSSDIAPEGEK